MNGQFPPLVLDGKYSGSRVDQIWMTSLAVRIGLLRGESIIADRYLAFAACAYLHDIGMVIECKRIEENCGYKVSV